MANSEKMTQDDLNHHADQLNENEGTSGINKPRKAVKANREKQIADSKNEES